MWRTTCQERKDSIAEVNLSSLCAALARNASQRELETPRPHMRECRGQCEEVNAAT
jgi:hypothetical protein